MRANQFAIILLLIVIVLNSCNSESGASYKSWQVYGGNKESNHYSSLTQIDTNNVAQLKVVWTYHTGDADSMSQIQVNPIVIDGVLYGVSPKLKLFAVNATSGLLKWVYDPVADENNTSQRFQFNACRGVTYYSDGKNDQRIFYTAGSKLYAINAVTGQHISSFGTSGKI